MKNILKTIYVKLVEYWHVPAGVLFTLLSLWAGAMFVHFCASWMELPGVITTLVCMIAGICLALTDVDWTRQY